jgi:hypothetical protein
MKDFYQSLNLPSDADDDAIGRALANAEPSLREEAEFILLHPSRRQVYDRNHHLLRAIAQLRMHLGLNYTRFWARQEYREFTAEPMPAEVGKGKRVNSMMIANAIARFGRKGRDRVASQRNWGILVILGAILVALLLVVLHWNR